MNARMRKQIFTLALLLIAVYVLISLYNASRQRPVVQSAASSSLHVIAHALCNATQNATCASVSVAPSPATAVDDGGGGMGGGILNYARHALSALHLNRTRARKPSAVKKAPKIDYLSRATAPPLPPGGNFSEPAVVMLLSYQRSGSTFMGDLLDRNPSMFYMYEPLDALYGALYGIPPGWSVPSDITGLSNGSVRSMPEHEVETVAQVLESMLFCRFNEVPSEVLISQFWIQFWNHHTNIVDYTKCLRKQRVSVSFCQSHYLKRLCDRRFGMHPQQTEKCFHLLASSSSGTTGTVGKYKQCIAYQRKLASPCLPLLRERCEHSPVRAVKTVRATMRQADVLMQRLPNMKLLHLFRDPRPVMLSRLKHESFRSQFSKKNVAVEAKFYCGIVDEDLHLRDTLMQKYPGRIREIIYEDFVANPLENAKDIYDFLGVDFAPEVKAWLRNSTVKSSDIAQAWKKKIKKDDQLAVETTCKHLFEHGSHVWQL